MTYRILTPEEWPLLHVFVNGNGFPVPDPSIANAAVAEDEAGNIVGCLFLQLVAHMEPLVIDKPGVNFLRLQKVLEDQVRSSDVRIGYYSLSGTPKIARMCEKMGMELLPYAVWRKDII